ncbi:response regulator [Roseobacter weihaiensis]|uniref:response regulator n=1 Tax=Roseobacter weihaiensis TaxID=2763262 RepID=UPI001D0BA20F|nr:response regulator [Roseobacter sp. H9]
MSKILLMEDDLVQSYKLKEDLETAGYTVVVRTSASEAIEELSHESYDLLISDIIVMKDQRAVPDGGILLINWIRRSPKHRKMPIIVMSGTSKYPGMGSILRTAQQIGADVGLEKPVVIPELLDEIARLEQEMEGDHPGRRPRV